VYNKYTLPFTALHQAIVCLLATLEKEAALSLTLLASSSIESTAAKRNKTTTNKTKTKHSRKKTFAKPKKRNFGK
jgi:hypothetical protein